MTRIILVVLLVAFMAKGVNTGELLHLWLLNAEVTVTVSDCFLHVVICAECFCE